MTAATFPSQRGKNSLTFCLKLTCSPSSWMAVQMTVLLKVIEKQKLKVRGKSRVLGRERVPVMTIRMSDVDSNGEIDSESECEQSEDETFRNANKFVEIEDEMEYN